MDALNIERVHADQSGAVQDHSLNVLVKISTDEGLWGIGKGFLSMA